MTSFYIKNSDKGEKGDITRFLQKVLKDTEKTPGKKEIVFEKGEYHFYKDFAFLQTIYASNTDSHKYPEKSVAIDLSGQKELVFDGGGSLFLMHGKMTAVKAEKSENLILKNFSWDFPCAATLEMKVEKAGKNYAEFSIMPSAQWEIKGNKLHWFEKSPFSKEMYWHNVNDKECWSLVGNDTFTGKVCRFAGSESPFNRAISIKKKDNGNIFVRYLASKATIHREGMIFEICTSAKRDCVGSIFAESKNIEVENVNVHYMHGFGWLSQMCENVSFKNCSFTPRKGSDRHCTSFADLLHFSGAKGKVHIENCNFSNAHDDPINIHGTFTRVKKAVDKNTLQLRYVHRQQSGFPQYHKGDKVVFCRRATLESFQNERIFTVEKVVNPLENGNSIKEMTVTFKEEIPDEICKPEEYVADNISYTPEVYIGSCRFEKIPTRGILCSAGKKVIIENNVFDSMTMASIYISDDCNDWYESGAVHDMTIRNNEFIVKIAEGIHGHKPAIFIEPIVADKTADVPCVHKNILIENNIFRLEHECAVEANFTENITIRGNKVLPLGENSTAKAFIFNRCEAVKDENNLVDLRG